jgi:ABC-2 type transport system ATP-binding protein
VKFYSSGMYVRLGFAVAVNVDPDVLVIDEVLAVGDERFQRKCMERIKRFQREGRTILFVSHSPDQVRAICDRAVVLSDGSMIGLGSPGEAVRIFRERLLEADDVLALGVEEPAPGTVQPGGPPAAPAAAGSAEAGAPGLGTAAVAPEDSRPIRLGDVSLVLGADSERRYLLPGEPLIVRVAFDASERVDDVVVQIEVRAGDGSMLMRTDTEILGVPCRVAPGPGAVDFRFGSGPFGDGAYEIGVGVLTQRGLSDWREPAARFEVMNPTRSTGVILMPVEATVVAPGALAFAPTRS